MSAGIGLIDILVSEITMVLSVLVFIISAVIVFMKKHLTGTWKKAAVLALVVSGLYLGFIVWLVFMWG